MSFMKGAWVVTAVPLLLCGCLMRAGNYSNVETVAHERHVPGPAYEIKVFGPMPFEEVKEFVRQQESEGWMLCGHEPASLPEDVMVDSTELDGPAKAKRGPWSFDIPKTMDDSLAPPPPKLVLRKGEPWEWRDSIPPYVDEDVRNSRQKYLVIMRRWL